MLSRFRRSAKTYLVLTGAGAVAVIGAPFAALYLFFKREPTKTETEFKNHAKKKLDEFSKTRNQLWMK